MRVSREALAQSEAPAPAPATVVGRGNVSLGPWYAIGPFQPPAGQSGFTTAFPPEQGINLGRSYGKMQWTPQPRYTDGVVHPLSVPSNAALYLTRTITSPRSRAVKGYFGSDDGMVAWLNGKKLLSVNEPRGAAPGQNTVNLPLIKGENRLLVKIYNRGGGSGFYFSTTRKARARRAKVTIRHPELWRAVARHFSDAESRRQMQWEQEDRIWEADWRAGDFAALAKRYAAATRGGALGAEARRRAAGAASEADLAAIRKLYYRARRFDEGLKLVGQLNVDALRRAIEDLTETFGPKYPKGREYLARLRKLEGELEKALAEKNDPKTRDRLVEKIEQFRALRREALLANPLLDFDKLLVIKRSARAPKLGLPQNWQGNCVLPRSGFDNEIATLRPVGPEGELRTVYRPKDDRFVGDVDLHFDADRMLFSMHDDRGLFQIHEIGTDGKGLRQVTPGDQPDVHNYDACYLPNGKIAFASTACFQGVPCVGGGNRVANLYLLDPGTKKIRRLCFDQDHNWCPTVMSNGRVMYSRWEYSDSPHYFTRLLFYMNPDGTGQMELYGSNSYWPNSIFYARPIPGHPTKVAAVISGHHGVPRMGELVIFDTARGQRETEGAVQRIPGYGLEVPPTIQDGLVNGSWPKFLHPYPLSEKYLLVSCQPTSRSNWGLYLVDVFDNMLLLREEPGYALLEPLPLRKTFRPAVIPDKVDLKHKDAIVYLSDIYTGGGLKGVPRGSVKRLRLFAFHYAYTGMGGHIHIGIDGPWDVHQILGTVPVYEDGSAVFRVPANTPIAVQPLDAEGKALQLMRSWFTAMPGEKLSCVGCHERQSTSPPNRLAQGMLAGPADIEPWRGPARGLSFKRDVQPVLDKYCVGCHNGQARPDGRQIPDFRLAATQSVVLDRRNRRRGFTPSYRALHPFVRRPGPESDYHMLPPLEYHADTSELVQMLRKGHHNVKLDAEAWDRLITWIDLNVPDHGTWGEHRAIASNYHQRRRELDKLYANLDIDPEEVPNVPQRPTRPVLPKPLTKAPAQPVACPGWPSDAAEAKRRQAADGEPIDRQIELGKDPSGQPVTMALVRVPAGEFVMGDASGCTDEAPLSRVRIDGPFWIGKFELTNQQYALFDPAHDSRYICWYNKDQNRRGEPANRPTQPVIRISWQQAMAFCSWLSAKTGLTFSLPTEAQWEYACRAGTATPMNYGAVDADFGKLANFADQRVNNLTRRDSPKWIPSIDSVNDGSIVTDNVGKYQPNAWGLCDMHGNVAEWTRTTYRPYPYRADDGRDDVADGGRKVVRGGSFYDRPKRGRSAFRLSYPPWQQVYNVGFRVVCRMDPKLAAAARK